MRFSRAAENAYPCMNAIMLGPYNLLHVRPDYNLI